MPVFRLPPPEGTTGIDYGHRIEEWLADRGYVVLGVGFDEATSEVLIESDADPAKDIEAYAPTPTREEADAAAKDAETAVHEDALRVALTSIRGKVREERTEADDAIDALARVLVGKKVTSETDVVPVVVDDEAETRAVGKKR